MKYANKGFSKCSKAQKIEWLVENHFTDPEKATALLKKYWNSDTALQQLHDEFTENTITNYYLPFGIVPNFLINNKVYTIPMAIEESSVVAAAGKAAKFWSARGGFRSHVISTFKTGQVHFFYSGNDEKLRTFFHFLKPKLLRSLADITKNMEKRGGGILDISLRDRTFELKNYYQIHCVFETLDAMGANFINSCLEKIAEVFSYEVTHADVFTAEEKKLTIIASILSNYVPDCLVKAEVFCKVSELNEDNDPPEVFAEKFIRAVDIAKTDTHRAVTHNKGIMNGVDAVIIATGNDFRAIEAGVHAYAARKGSYRSLTHAIIEDDIFRFWIEIPLALGTVGGLTTLHPLAKIAIEMLGNPNAKELMQIVAVAGLAQNFAALRSLITTGIQKGHMKMHLLNILNQMKATKKEKEYCINYFKDKKLTYNLVVSELKKLREDSNS